MPVILLAHMRHLFLSPFSRSAAIPSGSVQFPRGARSFHLLPSFVHSRQKTPPSLVVRPDLSPDDVLFLPSTNLPSSFSPRIADFRVRQTLYFSCPPPFQDGTTKEFPIPQTRRLFFSPCGRQFFSLSSPLSPPPSFHLRSGLYIYSSPPHFRGGTRRLSLSSG